MMNLLIIYDIRDPKRLTRIAKIMIDYGIRVQKSVFEASLDNKSLNRLRRRVKAVMEEEDYVVFFTICERDWQKKIKYGPANFVEPEEKPFLIL